MSDLGLPDIPGDVLIGAVRAPDPGRMPILVITGEREPLATGACAAGADVVFTKTVEWGRVVTT